MKDLRVLPRGFFSSFIGLNSNFAFSLTRVGGGTWQVLFMTKSRFFASEKGSRHFLLLGGFLGAGKTSLIGLMTLAPLSVVLDARRVLAALGGRKQKGSFHRDVGYVYRKQLEEAEWLVINKIDLLEESDREDLKERLEHEFPGRRQFYLSAKTGEGVAEWVAELVSHQSSPSGTMAMDYERYAEGEALLGWVNLEGRVSGVTDPGHWLEALAGRIAKSLETGNHEVGHFKMSLAGGRRRWRVHLVMGGDEVELIEEGERIVCR